jgi:very-long-chain ceramide synthase
MLQNMFIFISLTVLLASSLKLLALVVLLWANWEFITPYVAKGLENPFSSLLFISHRVPESSPEDPRYQKGYLDLVFIAFYVLVWSFVRQAITLWLCLPLARWYGIKKEAKLDRFGEQGYAVIYFAFTGFWGLVRTPGCLPRPFLIICSIADNGARADVVL